MWLPSYDATLTQIQNQPRATLDFWKSHKCGRLDTS